MTQPLAPDLGRTLDAVIDAAMGERVVGATVLVMQDGRPAYSRSAGFADRASGRAVTGDTIFRLASLTKPMITAAALSLVEAGVLDLDEPVTRWLPEFQPRLVDEALTITVRHLLTHTAGLSYGFMQPEDGPYLRLGVSDGMDQPGLGFGDELDRIVQAGLFYPPGSQWLYSVSMDVLGAAMEKATGQTLAEVFAERVGEPLGMTDTGFAVYDPSRLATPYADGSPPVEMGETCVVPFAELSGIRFAPGRAFDPASFPSAGAGMVGTAGEFMAFLEAIRTGGAGVVAPATAAAMMSNQTGDLAIVTSGPGVGFGFGGAIVLDPTAANSVHSPGTWLWGGVYGHSWFVDPARNLSCLIMTNTAIEGMSGQFSIDITAAVQARP
jgi:CubicO group peptidase (beta-lactamase class C family)